MQLGIKGQVVVYTGAAGLIGSAGAKALAREGASLALVDIDTDRLAALAADIASTYPHAKIMGINDLDALST